MASTEGAAVTCQPVTLARVHCAQPSAMMLSQYNCCTTQLPKCKCKERTFKRVSFSNRAFKLGSHQLSREQCLPKPMRWRMSNGMRCRWAKPDAKLEERRCPRKSLPIRCREKTGNGLIRPFPVSLDKLYILASPPLPPPSMLQW